MKNLLIFLLVLFASAAQAQFGTFDNTFGAGGIMIKNVVTGREGGSLIALEPGGKLLVAGYARQQANDNFCVSRYNANGTVEDTSFGDNGVVFFDYQGMDDQATGLVVLPDGKILLCGIVRNSEGIDLGIIRLNYDGGMDTTFGEGGAQIIDVDSLRDDQFFDMDVQPDGKIVVVGLNMVIGDRESVVIRLNPDGSFDNTFDGDGKIRLDFGSEDSEFRDVIIQPDGKILCIGVVGVASTIGDFLLVRFDSTGIFDQTFGDNGVFRLDVSGYADYADKGILMANGKILISGKCTDVNNANFALVKLNADGSLDTTFGTDGIVSTDLGGSSDYAYSMVEQPDGKIIQCGATNTDIAIVRYSAVGSLDSSFGVGGKIITDLSNSQLSDSFISMILQPDGKLLASGTLYHIDYKTVVCRFTTGLNLVGLLEFSQTETAPLLYPNPLQNTEHLKYTLGSDEKISIVLLDSQGKLVTTFVENENQPKGDHEVELNLPGNLPNGTYFIQIASPRGKISIKTIK
jgi:uncharacterized delta-60 repeat protein